MRINVDTFPVGLRSGVEWHPHLDKMKANATVEHELGEFWVTLREDATDIEMLEELIHLVQLEERGFPKPERVEVWRDEFHAQQLLIEAAEWYGIRVDDADREEVGKRIEGYKALLKYELNRTGRTDEANLVDSEGKPDITAVVRRLRPPWSLRSQRKSR